MSLSVFCYYLWLSINIVFEKLFIGILIDIGWHHLPPERIFICFNQAPGSSQDHFCPLLRTEVPWKGHLDSACNSRWEFTSGLPLSLRSETSVTHLKCGRVLDFSPWLSFVPDCCSLLPTGLLKVQLNF